MTVDDDPDRDPLADARVIFQALAGMATVRDLFAALADLDDDDARIALAVAALDARAGRSPQPAPSWPQSTAEPKDTDRGLPPDPFGDGDGPPDAMTRARMIFDALVDQHSAAELYRALTAVRESELRWIVFGLVLDRMGRAGGDEATPDDA